MPSNRYGDKMRRVFVKFDKNTANVVFPADVDDNDIIVNIGDPILVTEERIDARDSDTEPYGSVEMNPLDHCRSGSYSILSTVLE